MFFKEHLNFKPQMTIWKVLWRRIEITGKKTTKLNHPFPSLVFHTVLLTLIAATDTEYFVDFSSTKKLFYRETKSSNQDSTFFSALQSGVVDFYLMTMSLLTQN